MVHSLTSTTLYIQHSYLPCSGFWAPCDANVVTQDDNESSVTWLASFRSMLDGLEATTQRKKKCQKKHRKLVPFPLQTLRHFCPSSLGRGSKATWQREQERHFFLINDETDCAGVRLAEASTNGRPSSMATGSVTKTTFCSTPPPPSCLPNTHTPLFLGYITLLPSPLPITWLCAFTHTQRDKDIRVSHTGLCTDQGFTGHLYALGA